MPISSNRYVDITSGVGGGTAVAARELMLRLYSTNELIPAGSVLSFGNIDAVLDYFGDSALEEYKQAAYYFGFVSKVITQPKNIQFARWADAATSSQIFGSAVATLTQLQTYTTGAITVTIGGVDVAVSGLDFSADASYADVASAMQTAMQSAGGALAAATVTYNATRSAFEFDSNDTEDGTISVSSATSGFLVDLGWSSSAIFSDGVAVETVTEVVTAATQLNNNYGSFSFIDALTTAETEEAAVWTHGRNVEFQFHQKTLAAGAQGFYDDLAGYSGVGITLYLAANEDYPWLLPCAILASQEWNKPAASANYKYQVDARLTPTVTTDADADTYDAIRTNYYGQTQEAGTLLAFYQRGQLMGGPTAPTAMGVFANEQWFKSNLKSQFLSMLLAYNQVPADDVGKAIGYTYLDAGIEAGKFNGTIADGKTLTTTQKGYISQLSGDADAWRDVASKGYWRTLDIVPEVVDDVTTYYIDYTIIYAKRDSVDRVQGRHALI